ncbi:MAG: SpoIID/LytB domain-containing protein [Planctomycetes bacterium]|nr:SpoIID/LytB domain-containing protein [Planctomycetota bacterium]
MLRWLFRLVVVGVLGFVAYRFLYLEAPNRPVSAPIPDMLAANLPGRGSHGQPEIRVLVAEALDSALLTINGRVRMEAVTTGMQTRSGVFSQSVTVDVIPTGQGVKVGEDLYVRVRLKNLDNQPLRLTWGSGSDETTIAIPHEIEMYGTHVNDGGRSRAKVRVLARLPIEDYLYGVVAGEVPTSWPLEALKAQAVASRSFAYFEVRRRQNDEYDVHASTRSQVWRPSLAVEPQVKRAVDSTAGIVITEKNALIKTFFHSECGGYTADARWVFTKTPILALSGVRCPRCSDPRNKPTSWTVTYTRQEIQQRLRRAGVLKGPGDIRVIQGLDAEGRAMGNRALGRVVTVQIAMAGDRGVTVRVPANEFRLAMGADRRNIASTYMTIEDGSEPRITFSGLGWGHGVGLCQHGAAFAADKLRFEFIDILRLYYPGCKLVRLWG